MDRNPFLKDRAGNIGTLAALSLPLMVFSLALGVDFGYLTVQQRALQADADLAAIAAASNVMEAEKATAAFFSLNRVPANVTGRNACPSRPTHRSTSARRRSQRPRSSAAATSPTRTCCRRIASRRQRRMRMRRGCS